jgi:1-acyl-sn-glycerol-3-phosphate acyltransferase
MLDRDDVTALVADKYKHYPLFSWVMRPVNVIWINREEADLHAMRRARDFLRAGSLLGIAPEGTRSRTGGLMAAKTGVAYLADKAGALVIPTAISGTETAVRRLLTLRKPSITVQFGDPVDLLPLARGNRDAILQRNTDEIMCRIAAMLPEQYRGVYADHPRLRQLLGEPGKQPLADEVKVGSSPE